MAAIDREINEQNATFKTPWTALSAATLCSVRNASWVRGGVNERPCMEGRTARRPPVNGTSPKMFWAGQALLLLAKRSALHPRTDALRLHCDAHLGVALDGLTTCPGHDSRINKMHPQIRLKLCASRDAPHISPASVILFANVLGNGCPFHCQHSTPHLPP